MRLMLACVLVGVLAVPPAGADTQSDLDAAEQQLESAQTELDRLGRLWQEAEAQLARSQDAARAAQSRIAELERDLAAIQGELDERAAALFIAGGNPQALALLTSRSVTDAIDRMEFASAVAEGDSDLATRVSVEKQELSWRREQLAAAVSAQARAANNLDTQQQAVQDELGRIEARVGELQVKLAAERSPSPTSGPVSGDPRPGGDAGPVPTGTGWLQTCPVNGPTSFVDSFGDPRPGGRSHQGIDMIAARGTPVVAVHGGTVHRTGSSIGGLGIVLFHEGSSDWTFYTHFDSYGSFGEGAHAPAGGTIGYVGNTGTTVYHLHFEYHPGGGAAIDPYTALLGVC